MLLNSAAVPRVAVKFSHFERTWYRPRMFYTDHKYGGLLYYVPARITISAIYGIIFHPRNSLSVSTRFKGRFETSVVF